jgi:hypothetical protein
MTSLGYGKYDVAWRKVKAERPWIAFLCKKLKEKYWLFFFRKPISWRLFVALDSYKTIYFCSLTDIFARNFYPMTPEGAPEKISQLIADKWWNSNFGTDSLQYILLTVDNFLEKTFKDRNQDSITGRNDKTLLVVLYIG